ncbi:MAG TPA: hypothetical protein VEU96_05710 [Bryobacteraceae bacterium]|nr:hypothetical protein [Bryobacteraceae bacterium]
MRKIALAALLLGLSACMSRFPVETPVDLKSTCPQILRFSANPPVIKPGGKTLISWNIRNTSRIVLEESAEWPASNALGGLLHHIGEFPANGTLRVSPARTTTYVLSAGDEKIGCVAGSITVTVKR